MITVNATERKDCGKSANRRLRIANKFPAIVYGRKEKSISIILNHDEIINLQNHPRFYNEIIILNIDGKKTNVKVQDIQRHSFKPKLQHIDFIRVYD